MTLFTSIAYLDAPEFWQISFQDPATPVMEGIIHFHDDIMFYVLVIGTFVTYLLVRCLQLFLKSSNPVSDKFIHGTTIEIVWTVVPAIILMFIAIPSFALLYSIDEIVEPAITVKVVGHQWYWTYEYGMNTYNNEEIDDELLNFESYMVPESELTKGALRLLETDRRLVLPTETHLRFIITSADVLHSWAIPSLGLKLDACPGRLNEVSTYIKREGVFYGQCSEICGINHGFMPIVIQAVKPQRFIDFLKIN